MENEKVEFSVLIKIRHVLQKGFGVEKNEKLRIILRAITKDYFTCNYWDFRTVDIILPK